MRKLELLAPAKNLECGIAAIDCGADAVYIGAARFGARAAAGNSVDDIGRLCQYAHRFDAKVYVTLNTIIYDSEMNATLALAEQLREAGVDALLCKTWVWWDGWLCLYTPRPNATRGRQRRLCGWSRWASPE